MDRRKLHLGIGYCSLFSFCTHSLGYSESAAGRRIKAARCMRDFPEVYNMLSKNELTLSVVCKVADILTEENKHELFTEVRHQSARKVDEIVARYRPESAIRDNIKTVFIQTPMDTPVLPDQHEADANRNSASPILKSGAENQNESSKKNDKIFTADVGGRRFTTCTDKYEKAAILEKKYKLEFAVKPECMKKLEEVKVILSRKYPKSVPLGTLLEEALDAYLDKNSPERKKERREKREAKRQKRKSEEHDKRPQQNKTDKAGKKNSSTNKPEAESSKNRGRAYSDHDNYNRHIPQAVRDEVFARDNGKCAYVSPDGIRCNSTWDLEIDHIIPFARRGGHSINNLRLLCRAHNQHEADRTYGRQFMERRRKKA
jgi:5-methylcytosine-specific restriction endonuclease McrA